MEKLFAKFAKATAGIAGSAAAELALRQAVKQPAPSAKAKTAPARAKA